MEKKLQRREELLNELRRIHEAGPIVGEDESRRAFFIQEELSRTPERETAEILVELVTLISDDVYRENDKNR